jgi:hypothetical protein
MATDIKTPNSQCLWYPDGNKIAILVKNESTGKWDSYSGTSQVGGIRIHSSSYYDDVTEISDDLYRTIGLEIGLHNLVVDYVKYRLIEDSGDLQSAMYFLAKFDKNLKTFPTRKSGVRVISVPKI